MSTTTPLCRCRVLYIGSSVPTIAKDGLQGIQEPMNKLYPVDGVPDTKGIDSWLSVWVNGVLLEYVDGDKEHFFPIDSLHYCAAVRYVNAAGYAIIGRGAANERFLPLESPFANLPDSCHPPIFAAVLRRTTGVKILECHAFICLSANAANALVQCCFHAYADFMYLRQSEMATATGSPKQPDPLATADESKVVTETSLQNERDQVGKSYSRSEIDFRNGDESEDSEQEGVAAAVLDAEEPIWQRRQQTGNYDSVSISSTTTGRYRKKEATPHILKVASLARSSTSKAVVPYNPADIDYRYRTYVTEQSGMAISSGGSGYEHAAMPAPIAMHLPGPGPLYPYEPYSTSTAMVPPYSPHPLLPPNLSSIKDSPPLIPPWLTPTTPPLLPPPFLPTKFYTPIYKGVTKKASSAFKKSSSKHFVYIPTVPAPPPPFPPFRSFEEPPFGYRSLPPPPPISPTYINLYGPRLFPTYTYNPQEMRDDKSTKKKHRSTQSLDRSWRRSEPLPGEIETEYLDRGIMRQPYLNEKAFSNTLAHQKQVSAKSDLGGKNGPAPSQSVKKQEADVISGVMKEAQTSHVHSNGVKDGDFVYTSRIEQNMATLSLNQKGPATASSNPSSQLNRDLMY